MKILVVIVNWRTPQLTVQCLRALAGEVTEEVRVVVADNDSRDDSLQVIADAIAENHWHWCDLLPLPRNGGFAYGNNAAIRFGLQKGNPEYLYLLNPDTIVFPGVIARLVEFMDAHRQCGIAGSRAENPDGSVRRSAFRFPSIAGEFERQAEWGLASRLLRRAAVALPIPDTPTRVDWVSGCGMMIRRDVYDRIGPLDEGYFMYYEETDFCRRAARCGIECWYVPASRLIHLVGQSSGVTGAARGSRRRPAYWFESRWRYFEKNHSWLYAM
ncbi:MAG: glycosyltransferase family 2 protein, partial [Phycisphaerae bacterium]|nr:glycosyltransferase family 2 protein [Phycisphaerae bacterium]MDW8261817.1 glycosyltransferase family 2 protein [Phycisphaerales bacterium]